MTGKPSCKDEARIGQKNGIVRQWARRGTRPRQPADQRYENAYLFGAICPAKGKGAALALPYADTNMMQLHLNESRATLKRARMLCCSWIAPDGIRPKSSICRGTSRRSCCRRGRRS
nr:Putative transposase [Methylocystis sp. SC2]